MKRSPTKTPKTALPFTAASRQRSIGGKTQKRSEQAHAAIFQAALELLDERGYGNISVEAIAERSGSAKTTIYRWWPSLGALVLDAYIHTKARQIPVPETPDARTDLLSFVTGTCRALRETSAGPAMAALMAEAQSDPAVRDIFRDRWIASRRAALRSIVERVNRERPRSTKLNDEIAIDCLYGAIWYRLLNGHAPLSDRFARTLVEQVLGGAI